jgi:hypothetical protein
MPPQRAQTAHQGVHQSGLHKARRATMRPRPHRHQWRIRHPRRMTPGAARPLAATCRQAWLLRALQMAMTTSIHQPAHQPSQRPRRQQIHTPRRLFHRMSRMSQLCHRRHWRQQKQKIHRCRHRPTTERPAHRLPVTRPRGMRRQLLTLPAMPPHGPQRRWIAQRSPPTPSRRVRRPHPHPHRIRCP